MNEPLSALLESNGVSGRIITPLSDVLRKIKQLVDGDPSVTFGLSHLLPATTGELLTALSELAGAPIPTEAGPNERSYVDPHATAAQTDAAAHRLRKACDLKQRVLFVTGHPTGPLQMYISLAKAMAARGAQILQFAEAEPFEIDERNGRFHIRYVGQVGCLSNGGDLLHVHSSRPMEYLLDTGPAPDLVVGDHGFAGAALARGADVVALVDTNDPALVLAWLRGMAIFPILCDDNRPPASYAPMASFMIQQLPERSR